jgi:hypothetical protein
MRRLILADPTMPEGALLMRATGGDVVEAANALVKAAGELDNFRESK